MWVAAFIGMATSFAECSLARFIKNVMPMGSFVADRHGIWARAGDALDGRSVRRLFAHRLGIIFSGIQANAVARALSFSLIFPRW